LKSKIKLDKIVLIFFLILAFVIFGALYFQYNYSKNILTQNFINKHSLDTIKIRESFKALLDKAQYYFKTSEDENFKMLNILRLLYNNKDFNVDKAAKVLNQKSKFGSYEVFLIDKNYKVIDGSYKPDIGYDLSMYKNVFDEVFSGKKRIDISPAHLDVSSMNLKKYYLIASPDKKYLLQLGFVVDMFEKAKKLYNKILNTTEDLKELKLYYIDGYLVAKINFDKRFQKKIPIDDILKQSKEVIKEILSIANVKIPLDNLKKHIYIVKLIDDIFSTHHNMIKKLDLKHNRLIFYTIIKGVFENKNNRLLIKVVYDTTPLIKDIESLRKRFLLILFIVIVGIFFIYKFVIDKVSNEIKDMVLHMKQNKKVENENSFIEEIYELKKMYNIFYEKINKEIEKNKKLLEENRRFIVDTVHQIKTPMSVITLNLDYIKNIINDKEIDEAIEEIDAAISMLVNSYNDLSYIASNETVEYKPEWLNLSEMVKQRVGFFSLIAKATNKKIYIDIDENVFYNINRIEFERLVDNNISNAIKYSKKRDIFVSLKRLEDKIVLKIESFGDKIKNPIEIFEKNYREHSHKRGLGIGLNIVKNICKKYGIKYSAYYQDGKNIFEYVFSI